MALPPGPVNKAMQAGLQTARSSRLMSCAAATQRSRAEQQRSSVVRCATQTQRRGVSLKVDGEDLQCKVAVPEGSRVYNATLRKPLGLVLEGV